MSITIKQLDTGLRKRLTKLRADNYNIELKVIPLGEQELGEFVRFVVPFTVQRVNRNGYYIFQMKTNELSKKKQIRQIKELLDYELKRKLQTLPYELMQYENFNTLNQIQDKVVNPSRLVVARECGVDIELGQFQRDLTLEELNDIQRQNNLRAIEQKTDFEMTEEVHNNRKEELKLLLQQKNELLQSELPEEDESLKEINKKIKKIVPELPFVKVGSKKKKKKKKTKRLKTDISDFSIGSPDQGKLNEGENEIKKD